MKHNEAGLSKQKELQKAHSVKARKPRDTDKAPKRTERSKEGAKSVAGCSVSSGEGEVRKRARQSEGPSEAPKKKKAKVEESEVVRTEVQVKIPKELKAWLVDDWDLITRQKQLVSLPAQPNIRQVLAEFVKESRSGDELEEVVAGLTEYFDCMLGTQLLYKQERAQYGDLLHKHPGTPMSELYGPEHLMRLFVIIGGMLSFLDHKSLELLLSHFQLLLTHLASHPSLLSTNHYIVSPPEHIRKVL